MEEQGKKFFNVRVVIEVPVDETKTKKHPQQFIVSAVSVTDAEAKVNAYYKDTTYNFLVIGVSESKIVDFIE